MGVGSSRALAGAIRGLSSGLHQREDYRRRLEDDARRDRQETRAQQSHDMSMRSGNLKFDQAQAEAEFNAFGREFDKAYGMFASSEGQVYEPLQRVIGELHPGDEDPVIQRSEDGKFTVDFGGGRVLNELTFEQLAGLASKARDPQLFHQDLRKRKEREQVEAAEIAKEQRVHGQKKELMSIDHRNRLAEREGDLRTADDGQMYRIKGDQAAPVRGPVDGLTFRGTESGKRSSMLQEIDEIAGRLPRTEGETSDQHWMRAAERRATLVGKNDPAAAVREFEKSVTAKLLGPDTISTTRPERLEQVKNVIRELVGEFASRYAPTNSADDPLGILDE